MGSSDTGERRSRVLFVYYTHTQQAKRVCDAMAEVLRARGWEVVTAEIEFTDPRYVAKFAVFPFRHAVFDILPLLWPQTRKETGEIRFLKRHARATTTSFASARRRGGSEPACRSART